MDAEQKNHIVVIMAGGTGTRLWPLSRKAKPKQFQSFLSEKTLLEETYDRAKLVVPEENIYISTGEKYCDLVAETLPFFPKEQLILEPFPKSTAPAIALISATLHAKLPESIVATIASDHAIENDIEFTRALSAAFETVSKSRDKLITVGINPTKPDTGLGYIKLGREYGTEGGSRIFSVEEFKEKPDKKTAEEYMVSFAYLWNAGYFIFSTETFSKWAETYSPELSHLIHETETAIRENRFTKTLLEQLYADVPEIAIEPLIVEKLPESSRLVIPAPIRWSDIGSWDTLYEFLKDGKDTENIEHGHHVGWKSKGNLIISNRKIVATLGTKDLIIIDTDDALLVARRDHAGEMKKLIEELKKRDLLSLL
jgi:mannose-1-phosphate guanylyltransferase